MTNSIAVRRVVFREFRPADAASAQGTSNLDPSSGGGARDLRYPHLEVGPIVSEMFPGRHAVRRKRGGAYIIVQAPIAELRYEDPDTGQVGTVNVQYEDPTDTRPNMGRLANTTRIPPVAAGPDFSRGVVFALLLENARDEVWFHWAYEDELRSGAWHHSIAVPLVNCLDDPDRRPNIACTGYIDLTTGRTYCHH